VQVENVGTFGGGSLVRFAITELAKVGLPYLDVKERMKFMEAAQPTAIPKNAGTSPLFLRIGFWVSIAIAVAVVIRRMVALVRPAGSGPPDLAALDRAFEEHAALTLVHILPALLFVVLTPMVLFRRSLVAERLLFPIGAAVGITAYAMSAYSVGGWIERSAVLLFDSLFLYSLWRAFQERFEPARKRRWLLRAIVILLGIATTRPVMGVFFATSRLTHLRPDQFFGIAFWIGFSINWLIVELWLRRQRGASDGPPRAGAEAGG
jgi:hypothetical protein